MLAIIFHRCSGWPKDQWFEEFDQAVVLYYIYTTMGQSGRGQLSVSVFYDQVKGVLSSAKS